jgi:hypothetical protein
MHEPGHLFTLRGDLTQLACDAVLVPTTVDLSVGDWSALVGTPPPSPRTWPEQPIPVESTFSERTGRPRVWLAATAGLHPAGAGPNDVNRTLNTLLDRVERFVRQASQDVTPDAASGRARPLLGLPVVGTGAHGLVTRPGAVVAALLQRLDELVHELPVDVAVVALSATNEALCRHWRRRLWARRHDGDEAGYRDEVLCRWRRGRVRDGEVAVETADAQLQELHERAAQGQLVPFFGSGISRAAGQPSWAALLDELSPPGAVELFEHLSEQDELQMADPFARAQVIANLDPAGGASLRQRLDDRLAVERLSLLHVELANLGATDAITTNYDRGYERACEATGVEVSIVPRPGRTRRLVKLHGSLGGEGGGEPLLTRSQLLDFTAERGALAGVLQMLLLTNHLLFVGYSMSDPSLHAAVHAVRRALEQEPDVEDAPVMATSLQVAPSPALAALWDRTVDVLWPDPQRYPTEADRVRQKEILLDLLADAASQATVPLLAMDEDAVDGDLTDEERELRGALQRLAGAHDRYRSHSPLWEPVARLLARYGR